MFGRAFDHVILQTFKFKCKRLQSRLLLFRTQGVAQSSGHVTSFITSSETAVCVHVYSAKQLARHLATSSGNAFTIATFLVVTVPRSRTHIDAERLLISSAVQKDLIQFVMLKQSAATYDVNITGLTAFKQIKILKMSQKVRPILVLMLIHSFIHSYSFNKKFDISQTIQ